MVEMAVQQLAAASPKVMGQRPELKFVNEQGDADRPDEIRTRQKALQQLAVARSRPIIDRRHPALFF